MIRALLLALVGLALVWLDTRTPAPAGILRADFGITTGVIVVTALANLFRLFGGKIDKNVKRALEGMRDIITNVGRTLAEFARDTAGVFATVFGFLRKFWDRVLLPMLRRLDGAITRIFKWLRDTFGPIIEALIWIRRKILEFYDKWFRPIFDTIDAIRRILGIFSLFGLEWSRKLDAKLAELEDALMRPIRTVLTTLNEVIGWVDRIITLDGFLQRVTLLRSLLRYERDMWKVWWESIRQREAEKGPIRPGAIATREPRASAREVATYARAGEDPDRARIRESVLDVQLALRGARPLPR